MSTGVGGGRGGRRLLFRVAVAVLVVVSIELSAWLSFETLLSRYAIIRSALLGDGTAAVRYQRSIAQPYLLYTPAPGRFSHNEGGYRGPAVPMRRRPGVARVLCLGGSTTYGWSVRNADHTYPAALERILEARRPASTAGVEVINGGIPAGSSAELLTHYHFKYHYFRPDVVVVNTGGNDAGALTRHFYQPDYSHWRTPLRNPEPLPDRSRWLLRSRFFSAFFIFLFRSEFLSGAHLEREDRAPPTRWYPEYDRRKAGTSIPPEDVAFVHNLTSLVREIRRDGGRVIFVAFREAPVNTFTPARLREIARNRERLRDLAWKEEIPYLPFPASVISPENWADLRCHLNEAGSAEKARYVAPTVESLLWPGTPDGPRP